MNKPSLGALREVADAQRSLDCNALTDDEIDMILLAFPALLAIAEAARGVKDVFPNSHPERCLCNPCVKHKHLRAALALVEE